MKNIGPVLTSPAAPPSRRQAKFFRAVEDFRHRTLTLDIVVNSQGKVANEFIDLFGLRESRLFPPRTSRSPYARGTTNIRVILAQPGEPLKLVAASYACESRASGRRSVGATKRWGFPGLGPSGA
jgi:hypothetical protein